MDISFLFSFAFCSSSFLSYLWGLLRQPFCLFAFLLLGDGLDLHLLYNVTDNDTIMCVTMMLILIIIKLPLNWTLSKCQTQSYIFNRCFLFIDVLGGWYHYYPHFTDKKIKDQRNYIIICPRWPTEAWEDLLIVFISGSSMPSAHLEHIELPWSSGWQGTWTNTAWCSQANVSGLACGSL